VALYNNALTAAEVQSLATGGSPLAGPLITSFTADKATAFEGDAVTLNWTVNTANVTGNVLLRNQIRRHRDRLRKRDDGDFQHDGA
jgi:hypothetical protein